jgi:hypothetical protein
MNRKIEEAITSSTTRVARIFIPTIRTCLLPVSDAAETGAERRARRP